MKLKANWLLLGISTLSVGIFLILSSEMVEANQGRREWIGQIDQQLFDFFITHRTPALNSIATNLTALGSGIVLSIFVTIAFVLFLMRSRKGVALELAISAMGSSAISALLKNHFERARPELVTRLEAVSSFSYPSGHSLSAAAVYFTIAIIFCEMVRSHLRRATILCMMIALITAIAVSRLYLGVHYFSDVSAGVLLGVAWACLLASVRNWQDREFEKFPSLLRALNFKSKS